MMKKDYDELMAKAEEANVNAYLEKIF